jgi:hypothetical protein
MMFDGDFTGYRHKGSTGRGRGAGKRMIRKGMMTGNRQRDNRDQCVCLSCGFKIKYQPDMPEFNMRCPKCSSEMVKILTFSLMRE